MGAGNGTLAKYPRFLASVIIWIYRLTRPNELLCLHGNTKHQQEWNQDFFIHVYFFVFNEYTNYLGKNYFC